MKTTKEKFTVKLMNLFSVSLKPAMNFFINTAHTTFSQPQTTKTVFRKFLTGFPKAGKKRTIKALTKSREPTNRLSASFFLIFLCVSAEFSCVFLPFLP